MEEKICDHTDEFEQMDLNIYILQTHTKPDTYLWLLVFVHYLVCFCPFYVMNSTKHAEADAASMS